MIEHKESKAKIGWYLIERFKYSKLIVRLKVDIIITPVGINNTSSIYNKYPLLCTGFLYLHMVFVTTSNEI